MSSGHASSMATPIPDLADVAANAEALRAAYRPDRIAVLFVGESAPAGGTFFYAGDSQVHRYLSDALSPHLPGSRPFLDRFRDAGLYLDDLVLTPVNRLAPRERAARNLAAVPCLAARLAAYRPLAVVGIAKTIAIPLAQALARAGLTCPLHVISFPGTGQQANFRREIGGLLPGLLTFVRS